MSCANNAQSTRHSTVKRTDCPFETGAAAVFFDIDGTLTGLSPKVMASNPHQPTPNKLGQQVVLPGRVAKLRQLRAQGVKIALITNRGGVAWGIISLEEAKMIAREAAMLAGVPDAPVYLCPHDPRAGSKGHSEYAVHCQCRKPAPGLIIQAARDLGVPLSDIIYVGDMESDRQAAAAAGVQFMWAGEYFRQETQEETS